VEASTVLLVSTESGGDNEMWLDRCNIWTKRTNQEWHDLR